MEKQLDKLVKDFFWCLVHQREKVPTYVIAIVDVLYDEATLGQKNAIARTIMDKIVEGWQL